MSSHNRKFLRITAGLVTATTLLSSVALAAFDSAFSYSYQLADSATYTRLEGKNGSGLQKANYIEYKPGGSVSPMAVYAGDTIYGSKATITNAANYLKQKGYTPIGGTNADFFVLGTGVPIGLVINNGTLVSSDAWQYAVGFMADGTAMIGQPSSSMKIEGPSGAVWISYFNKTRSTAGIYLLDSNYDDETHVSTNGKSIILERVDTTPVKVGGQVKLKVVAKGAGNGSTTITKNQMVLTMDDKVQATWVDYPIGEEVTLTVSSPDPRWGNVIYAVGGKNLVKNGTISTTGIDGGSSVRARTAVGVKDDGTVILYEIDGNQSSYSAGMTAAQLGSELKSMGYNNVLCLDGGGSSAMAVRIPGESDAKLISSPSDGSQRATANFLFLVNQATPDGVARHVHFRPSYYYILPGASTYFAAWGSDSTYASAKLPAGMTYTASSGTVDTANQIFTAPDTAGVVTLSGTSADGTVTGNHKLSVTTAVDSISLQSGGETVSSISLRGGQSINIDALVYHQKMQMAARDELLNWSVSGDIGKVDSSGVFVANERPATGKLTCSYGAVSSSISIHVGLSDPPALTTVQDFESAQPFESETFQLARVTGNDAVARGKGALSVTMPAQTTGELVAGRTLTDGMTYLSLYAKCSTAGGTVSALFENGPGDTIETPLTGIVGTGGFTQLTCTLPQGAVALTGLRVKSADTGTLYLDHILLSKEAVNNTDAPVITLTQAPTQVSAGAAATVTARITMNGGRYVMRPANVTATVDGVKSSAVYAASSGTISVATDALSQGLHQIAIEAVDDAGNRARKTVSITAGSATSSKFADTATHWANGYINFAANKGLLKGESANGVTNFNPSRNLRRSEFAVIMARYLALDTTSTDKLPFADRDSIAAWAAGAVQACYQAGIMSGQLDTASNKTYFNPNANITRAEVMTVMSRILPRGYVASTVSFTDEASIPSWAVPHVRYTVAAGLISGYEDDSIRAGGNITRAEIAKVFSTLY